MSKSSRKDSTSFTSRYRIGEFIGRGGFGHVFKLDDLKTGQQNVAKIIKMNSFRDLESYKQEIKNLIRIGKRKCYKHIVCLKDYAYYKNYIIVITNYIRGITLREFIEQSRGLEYSDVLYIMYQLILAMKTLHKKLGMAHLDIKPDNIMIDPETLDLSIIDFGLSCYKKECQAGGTLSYMAPEIRAAYNKFDKVDNNTAKASDIFSLGIVFYELLYCINPFRKVDTDFEYSFIITKILKGDHVSPKCNPKMSDAHYKFLLTFITHMIQFSYERRPDISDLEQVLESKAGNIYIQRSRKRSRPKSNGLTVTDTKSMSITTPSTKLMSIDAPSVELMSLDNNQLKSTRLNESRNTKARKSTYSDVTDTQEASKAANAQEAADAQEAVESSVSSTASDMSTGSGWFKSMFGKRYTKYATEDDPKYKNIIGTITKGIV